MKIKDPITELLAIKLYEHDFQCGTFPPKPGQCNPSWMKLPEADRRLYRRIANGVDALP